MKLTFLGGAGGVTGSKTVLEVGKESYLIDYGLFQGGSAERERNWRDFPGASRISAVFLTHAHIDHSGLLPRLWKDGFRGKIYCSEETYKLCQILLSDSAKIHEEDAAYANKKQYSRHKPALPLYTQEDAKEVLELFVPVPFETPTRISEKVNITLYWAGHILGSSFIRVACKNEAGEEKVIVFSGDLGHKRNILLAPPAPLCEADFLVLESTYGGRLHPRIPAKEVLGLYLNTILRRSGVAVVPAFSVGRTQDVLYLVKLLMDEGTIPRVPVILDSPLSRKANAIFNECFQTGHIKEDVRKQGNIYPNTLREIETVIESRQVNSIKEPMILISASGMLDGGRVVHHVKNRVVNKSDGIILVGYQPEGTKGRLLLDGISTLRMHKEEFPVKASIFHVNGLSAHADYLDIIEWLQESDVHPKLVMINHGEEQGAKHLKTLLESQLDWEATIADFGEEFHLDHFG
ncbi:MAG: MBL fold metallo-hydrolase [Deltaproteobacteria bacterium]|nr:MAG: MBL fold metallo-hydrolase [Deltaproteobacteria bacterium]